MLQKSTNKKERINVIYESLMHFVYVSCHITYLIYGLTSSQLMRMCTCADLHSASVNQCVWCCPLGRPGGLLIDNVDVTSLFNPKASLR
jgi:hypothetical protein